MRHIAFLGVVGLFVAGISNGRASASVTPGLTFTVASQSGLPATGTHYHSNLAGVFGNPPGLAEVGSLQDQALSSESIRGLSEFDLTGLGAGTATLSFRVYTPAGLFPGQNDFGFVGNIGVLAYAANNAEDIGDYSTATLAPIGTFSTAGLLAGSPVSFDATSIYNTQLGLGASSLGFRLQTTPATVTGGGAFTFDSFTLTVTPVPEPGALGMLGMLAAVAALTASGYRSPAARRASDRRTARDRHPQPLTLGRRLPKCR